MRASSIAGVLVIGSALLAVAVAAAAAAAPRALPSATALAARRWTQQNGNGATPSTESPGAKWLAARATDAATKSQAHAQARHAPLTTAALKGAVAGKAASAAGAAAKPAAARTGSVADPGVPTAPYLFNTYWYTQRLDHFNFQNNGTFQQKYLVNDTFWDGSGPIFFYTGNEGPIELFAQNTGFMWEVAVEFGALIVFTEHRYYGVSLPFGKASFQPANMIYLTSEQALADYAEFLPWFKRQYQLDDTTRIVAFGGSYGGMLAAWFRIKYPAIVAGSISASAPLLQFQESVSAEAFNIVVTEDFAAASPAAAAGIKKSWSIMEGMTPTAVSKAFNFCPNQYTNNATLQTAVFPWVSNAIIYMAMVDYPYPTTFLGPMPGYPVSVASSYFADGQTDAQIIASLAQAVGVFYNWTGEAGACYNISGNEPATLSDPGGWSYQSCTEMIMPMAQNNVDDFLWPVPWNYTAYAEGCFATYGSWPRPKMALQQYGGIFGAGGSDMTADSNIVFSNGMLDPWNKGGVLTNLSVQSNLIAVTYYGAHHLDLRAANDLDPQSVIDARNIHRYYIKVFLGTLPQGGLTNAQTAGVTVLCTVVAVCVGYAAYQSHQTAEKEKKARAAAEAEQRPDGFAAAVVAPNANKTSHGKAVSGAAPVASVYDSPHHQPILPPQDAPHRLSLQAH